MRGSIHDRGNRGFSKACGSGICSGIRNGVRSGIGTADAACIPNPEHAYRVGIYIRYFNQTRYDNYLDYHIQQYRDTLAMCPDWSLVDFYIDEGATAPNMETAPEWSRLLQDALDGKVDLIITQKVSNVSKKDYEIAFVARILAALDKPVGIYFVSEDIFTLASYYRSSLRDEGFFPSEDWSILPEPEQKALSPE